MEKETKKIVLSENESIIIETSFACLKIENKNDKLIVTEEELENQQTIKKIQMISRKKMLKKSSKCSFIVECFLFFML